MEMLVRVFCDCNKEFYITAPNTPKACSKCGRVYKFVAVEESPDEPGETSMIFMAGKMKNYERRAFRCECGSNVFTARGNRYLCNGCDNEYIGS